MDISAWLRGLGLERYEQAFRENAIDEAILPKLTAEDLRDLGVTAVGHRRILLDAIAALRAETFRDTTEHSVEPDRSGATRGRRHTMFEDSDVNYTRHIRGAVNAVIASVTGDTMCYVSAGAEHQGPPSGGVVAVLARVG